VPDLRATGAQTGARRLKALQSGNFVTVSKAVRGHWPLEGSNPSPPLTQAVLCSGSRLGAAVCGFQTAALSPWKSMEVPRRPLVSRLTGARLAHHLDPFRSLAGQFIDQTEPVQTSVSFRPRTSEGPLERPLRRCTSTRRGRHRDAERPPAVLHVRRACVGGGEVRTPRARSGAPFAPPPTSPCLFAQACLHRRH
jgi:hypothetical protein